MIVEREPSKLKKLKKGLSGEESLGGRRITWVEPSGPLLDRTLWPCLMLWPSSASVRAAAARICTTSNQRSEGAKGGRKR